MASLKYSRQRESIKEFLMTRTDHPTADTVYHQLRKIYPNISLGTIYRNLALLADIGEIQKICTGDGADRFDGQIRPHYHVICTRCHQVMDLDLEYMKEKLYPMMKEEALLYDQILVDSGMEITLEDGTKSTRLATAPAYSPEHGARTLGNTYEGTLVWQLYEDTIKAAELLGVDEDKVAEWKETQSRLSPIEIGKSGQIKDCLLYTSPSPRD